MVQEGALQGVGTGKVHSCTEMQLQMRVMYFTLMGPRQLCTVSGSIGS